MRKEYLMRRARHRLFWLWLICSSWFAPLVLLCSIGFSYGMGTPDTDQQMYIILLAAVPIVSLCFTGQMLLHHYLYRQSMQLAPFFLCLPLSYLMAWLFIGLLAGSSAERGLPMLNERSAAPFTWYQAIVGGWALLSLFGGFLYLLATSLTTPAAQMSDPSSR